MSPSSSLVEQIRSSTRTPNPAELQGTLRAQLDEDFPDLSSLVDHVSQAGVAGVAGPSSAPIRDRMKEGKKKRKRGLKEEIAFWEASEAEAAKELGETSSELPEILETTQTKLQALLSDAQGLSLQRYALADMLANLVADLSSPEDGASGEPLHEGQEGKQGQTLVEKMEGLQEELARLEAGLAWASLLERVLLLSEQTLSAESHRPSPLAALPLYQALHQLVSSAERTLPSGMALLRIVVSAREKTWQGLKEVMYQNLLVAAEKLKWPLRVSYPSASADDRRAFERAFQDLLYLQSEGEALNGLPATPPHWSSGDGLYPVQALVRPIAMRFRYHFQGSRNTNRVDKPEWAFANILDQIYEQQGFIEDYLQPLTNKAGYSDVDVKSEFTMLLLPILLSLLRTRIPKLLDHPALLAHTIYQAVVFDDAVRAGDFDLSKTSIYDGVEGVEWEGLTGVLLREEGWFERWLAGEKRFVDGQLHELISSSEAWTISDEPLEGNGEGLADGRKPTVSSRQIKSLVEQVTDRYAPLPALEHKLPFLTTIQLPMLMAYHSRVTGSLDAFETLSSAFVRAVPGALSGNTRGGVHVDPAKVTGGTAGLTKLVKAGLSAGWVLEALRAWSDDPFFVELSADLANASNLRWKIQGDQLLPTSIRSDGGDGSVFDVVIERYAALCQRSEDMIVRLVTVEVENDLKQHLQRRWDNTDESDEPDASLLNALATFTTLLKSLAADLAPLVLSRLYRRIVNHLSNHIQQRAVYAGWSKFTAAGGQAFYTEITDWIHAAIGVLETTATPANTGIEAPWAALLNIAKVLRLSTEDHEQRKREGEKHEGTPTFAQAMAAGWSDGGESLRMFLERAGVDGMGRQELQGVLRRRVECWR